ncbi:hypothetical protein FIU95_21170 (plasmid) [Microbulbifer sp. THAF38]|nr:hypothetical protein FIU95_21170 [Microbulbifer sp. THAF38]
MKFQVIETAEDAYSHIQCPTGNYASLCGLDGDDNDPWCTQRISGWSDKVTCPDCIMIWKVARSVKPKSISQK